jgi:hypothetical protein
VCTRYLRALAVFNPVGQARLAGIRLRLRHPSIHIVGLPPVVVLPPPARRLAVHHKVYRRQAQVSASVRLIPAASCRHKSAPLGCLGRYVIFTHPVPLLCVLSRVFVDCIARFVPTSVWMCPSLFVARNPPSEPFHPQPLLPPLWVQPSDSDALRLLRYCQDAFCL